MKLIRCGRFLRMQEMTSKQRFLTAINKKVPDRLPFTTHHLLTYFLNKYYGGKSSFEFFKEYNMDPIVWITPHTFDGTKGDYFDPNQSKVGFLESRRIVNDNWRIEHKKIQGQKGNLTRYNFITPKKTLSMVRGDNDYTSWVVEPLIKEKSDIEILAEYMTHPKCDIEEVNKTVDAYGEEALIRSHICVFDIFGQPGCWQDAVCMFGIEPLIMETYDDPQWVHEFLSILQKRKLTYINSMKGANYDILELGGGDASTTVISPKLFNEFVAPYDSKLIEAAHNAGQRIVYHTCGGMMPILEDIADMKPDAMETFTPKEMGADVDIKEAKRRIGDKVCMIGGFNQVHFLKDCSPEDTRKEVRRCFDGAGEGGGYILSPSDHFFDVDLELIKVYADEAMKCTY